MTPLAHVGSQFTTTDAYVGAVDLAGNRYRRVRLGVDLLRPNALFPNMTGRNVRMVWTLDGPFATANYSYRLTSTSVQFDNTGFTGLHAEGRGRLTPWPMRVPLRLTARASLSDDEMRLADVVLTEVLSAHRSRPAGDIRSQ